MQVTINTIRDAHSRIKTHVHKTPVKSSTEINENAGVELYFKCENLQRSRSFKIRGAVIKADIKAKDVQIAGEVKGNISASGYVHYMEDCTVIGNTTTARILIADGASIKGSVHIDI